MHFKLYLSKSIIIIIIIMYQLQYSAISASNYYQSFPIKKKTFNFFNWQSTPYAHPPIEILVKLNRRAYVLKLILKAFEQKPIHQLQIYVADNDSHLNDHISFIQVSTINNISHKQMIVNVSRICRIIKFVVAKKQERVPASIEILKFIGDYSVNVQSKPESNLNKQNTDKLLIELGLHTDYRQWNQDLELLPVDENTRITIRDICKIEANLIKQSDFEGLKKVRKNLNDLLEIGKKILQAQRRRDWAATKQNFKQAKAWNDEMILLSRQRDKYDQIYQTTRFFEMIEISGQSQKINDKFNELLEEDRKEQQQYKMLQSEQIQKKKQLLNQQYNKIKQQNKPWWEKSIHTIEDNQPDVQFQIQQQKPQEIETKSISKTLKSSKKTKKNSPIVSEQQKDQKYDFTNPYVFNQGDADLDRFMDPMLDPSKLNPNAQILRKYQQIGLLEILGSRAWLGIHSQNWRQREAAAHSVLEFTQKGIPSKYINGKSKNLFLALMQFARICCDDKVLQIYYDGLKILGTSLAPPICGNDVSPAMINKALKDFLPILIEKISEMNSRAKQISLQTLISVFNHPASDLQLLIRQCLKITKQSVPGKSVPIQKQAPRIILARLEILTKACTELPMQSAKNILKQVFNSLVVPSLFHSNYQVRMASIQLIGGLFRFMGEGMIALVNQITGLKPNLQQMILNKIDQTRQQMKNKKMI